MRTNNEVRANILASIEARKAWLQYHCASATCAPENEKSVWLEVAKTHAELISDDIDKYKSIPANDNEFVASHV